MSLASRAEHSICFHSLFDSTNSEAYSTKCAFVYPANHENINSRIFLSTERHQMRKKVQLNPLKDTKLFISSQC